MTKPQWEIELRQKIKESYAKGGFLTTDADGSWKVDEEILYSFVFKQRFESYQQGVEDMRRKCVDLISELRKGEIVNEFDSGYYHAKKEIISEIENYKPN